MKFILPYVSAADREFLKTGMYDVEYLEYDWNLNGHHHVR